MRKVSPPGLLPATLLFLVLAACDGFWTRPPAQATFQRTYGGTDADWGRSVAQTADGGYVIVGETWSFGAGCNDVYLVKTDASGDTTWTRTYGGSESGYGSSIAQTADGGYVIAGGSNSHGTGGDVWLIKADASGDTMWTHTYGGADTDCGSSVLQTADGGYIIAGYTRSFGAGSADVWLIKTDANGDTMWTRTFGGAEYDDYGWSVRQTADGGYVIAGWTESFGAGGCDVWLIKTDGSGDTVWTRTFGSDSSNYGRSVAQTADGGYVITGGTYSYGAGRSDVYLVKTDANGDTVWTRTFGGELWDEGHSVAQTTDGGYVIVGETWSFGAGLSDIWLIRTDGSGDTIWTRTFGGTDYDYGTSVTQATDGGYIIGGSTESFGAGRQDAWLIKTDANGNIGP